MKINTTKIKPSPNLVRIIEITDLEAGALLRARIIQLFKSPKRCDLYNVDFGNGAIVKGIGYSKILSAIRKMR